MTNVNSADLFVIFFSDMMHEWFKVRQDFEAAEFAQAFVTNHHRRNSFIKNPIEQREHRQTQPVRPRNKDDSDEHDKTSQSLVEIFLQVKLTASADGTAVKNFFNALELPPLFGTVGTNDRLISADGNLRKFFAGITFSAN